jgi:hypothetical protein
LYITRCIHTHYLYKNLMNCMSFNIFLFQECNGSRIGGFSKESIVYGTTVTPQNVINSNACIGSKNLINSMNTTTIGRSNVINTSKRKLDDTDNKSEVKKVSLLKKIEPFILIHVTILVYYHNTAIMLTCFLQFI